MTNFAVSVLGAIMAAILLLAFVVCWYLIVRKHPGEE